MTDTGDATGFTGVEWELRTPEELARALTAGPGPGQAGELAAVWSAAAAELEAVASEYRRLAVELSADWISEASPKLDDRSREVADDVFTLAGRARDLADRAAGHADHHAAARAAMPRAEEIAVTGRALAALDDLGPGLAGVLSGATDALETRRADHRRAAARVMAGYETHTAPLAAARDRPAETRHLLPGLARGPLDAVPGTASSAASPVPPVPARAGSLAPFAAPVTATAQPPGAQVRPATAGGVAPPAAGPGVGSAPPPNGAPAGERSGAGIPMIPPAAGARAAGGDDAQHVDNAHRPTPGTAEIEDLYGLSVAVAPPVFGGAVTPPVSQSAGGDPA